MPRDYEILRTLVRVQLAPSRSFQGLFFNTIHQANKRIAILKHAGLIAAQTKGLPRPYSLKTSHFWRLTNPGLEKVIERYPNERIPKNLITRTRRASLMFCQHREVLVGFYLKLLRDASGQIEDIANRADKFDWRHDHEVTIEYQRTVGLESEKRLLIPDATISMHSCRFFVELDKNTRGQKAALKIFSNYDDAFKQKAIANYFDDNLSANLLFVTETEKRAAKICKLIKDSEFALNVFALTPTEAAKLINRAIDSGVVSVPQKPDYVTSHQILKRLYSSCIIHTEECPKQIKSTKMGKDLMDAYRHLISREEA